MPNRPPTAVETRRHWMSVLAKAHRPEIEDGLRRCVPEAPRYDFLRRPETGLVMVRGRAGGDGQAFNLGEMTVTRCSVRLPDGTIGHAYVAGRDSRHAELAAMLDAMLQDEAEGPRLAETLIAPLAAAQIERRKTASTKAAATRVDFFTLVRGDD